MINFATFTVLIRREPSDSFILRQEGEAGVCRDATFVARG